MARVGPAFYSLNTSLRLPWNENQENSISKEYPYDNLPENESPEDYVSRTYLQFLWLPESIMDLKLLPSTLRRVEHAPSTSQTEFHPLHAILDEILLTARTVSSKYHQDLNQLLSEGGSGSDQDAEEAMMWYALTHEKVDDTIMDEPWTNQTWKAQWLEKMERRESRIQILLHFLKLSLPGPAPPLPQSPSKKRKKPGAGLTIAPPSIESRLESLMDKLSTWQLMGSIDTGVPTFPKQADDRDWMQTFCEDVVETCFKHTLPELCSLLHSKVFPSSPFSDQEDSTEEEDISSPVSHSSPIPQQQQPPQPYPSQRARSTSHRPMERKPSRQLQIPSTSERRVSPGPLSAKERPHKSARALPSKDNHSSSSSTTLSRSRSLSISLAEERRSRSVSVGAPNASTSVNSRRGLQREVSMSKSFKPGTKTLKAQAKEEAAVAAAAAKKKEDEAKAAALRRSKDMGQTLVEETPVKQRTLPRPSFGMAPPLPVQSGLSTADDDGEEDWSLLSSPDPLLLQPSSESRSQILAAETPVKKKGRKM